MICHHQPPKFATAKPRNAPQASNFILIGMVGLRTDPSALAVFAFIGIIYYLLAQQVQQLAVVLMPNQVGWAAVGVGCFRGFVGHGHGGVK